MTIATFEAVFYTLGFIVPGFICDSTLGLIVPRKSGAGENALLRFLTFSAYNYAIWSWLIYLIVKSPFFSSRPAAAAAAWGVIILVSPMVLALLIGKARQGSALTNLLYRFGVATIQPGPTAWDTFFSRTRPVWALVTLKDGSTIAGLFGSRSAAADNGTCDLYIETMCRIGDPWVEVPGSAGVWIRGDEIKYIEFHERRT